MTYKHTYYLKCNLFIIKLKYKALVLICLIFVVNQQIIKSIHNNMINNIRYTVPM